MKTTLIFVIATCVIAIASASAEDTLSISRKSPALAFGLSFACTAVPVTGLLLQHYAGGGINNSSSGVALIALGLAGASMGPGVGHLYAGNSDRFFIGFYIRGGIILSYGVLLASNTEFSDIGTGIAVFLTGLGLVVVSAAIDIVSAPGAARKYNRENGLVGLSIRPSYFASQEAFGLTVSLRL